MMSWLACMLSAGIALQAVASDLTVPSKDLKRPRESGRLLVLVVGVEQFTDDFWPTLQWSVDDAGAFANALRQGATREVRVVTLTNANATRANTLKALNTLKVQSRPNDIVAVYVSTHGTLAPRDDGELEKIVVLNDTHKDTPMTTGLRYSELTTLIDAMQARRKLLVLAMCHGGVGKSRLSPKVERLVQSSKGELAPLVHVSEGTLVLAAAAKGEAAREDDRLRGDVYTHFFIEGLKVYDRNRDGMVTALEAHDYAKEKTYAFTQGRQRPTADAQWIGDADVPLRGKVERRGVPVLEAYSEDYAGMQLKVDDGVKGLLPMAFPLAADGGSKITLYGSGEGKRLAVYRVRTEPGKTLTLDELLAPPPFSVAVVGRQEQWSDAAFERLTGQERVWNLALSAAYHHADAYVAFEVVAPKTANRDVRTNLRADSTWRRFGLSAGYGWTPRWGWHVAGGLQLANETMKLAFKDVASDAVDEQSNATLLGVTASIERDLPKDFGLAVDFGLLKGNHDFGDLGSVDASRSTFGFRLLMHLGGVGRRQ